MRIALAAGSLILLGLLIPRDVASKNKRFSELDAALNELMALHDVPGMAVAIVQGREIVYTKGYGARSTESRESVDDETRFALASVSKSFTALALMRLVDQGRLALDRPIVQYLPSLAVPDESARAKLTLRHLLSQSSGYPTLPEWPLRTRKEIIDRLGMESLVAPPGSRWAYCNQNFLLAGCLAEHVAGSPFEQLLRTLIFEPLGMSRATEYGYFSQVPTASSNHAAPHDLDVRSGMRVIPFEAHLAPWTPSGGLVACAKDLARYLKFQLGDGAWEGKRLLSKASMEEMHRPQVRCPQAAERRGNLPVQNVSYALGWYVDSFDGLLLCSHEGNLNGYTSSVTLVPAAGSGVGILTNADHVNAFLHGVRLELVRWLTDSSQQGKLLQNLKARVERSVYDLKARMEAARGYKVDPGSFEPLLGRYQGEPGEAPYLIVERNTDGLLVNLADRVRLELVPYERHAFLINSPPFLGAAVRFDVAADGSVRLCMSDGRLLAKKSL